MPRISSTRAPTACRLIATTSCRIVVTGGSVKAIEHGKVRIEEESIDFYGDRQTSVVEMELAADERGKR